MDQQKRKNSTPKEFMIVAFILTSTFLIITDVGKNLARELRVASESRTLSLEPVKPQPSPQSTLSEEELKAWTERLKKH